MIVTPKAKPIIENLNSYYVDIKKLFEHYQGELGSGAAHFKSPLKEAVIFFDKDDLLNGSFIDKGDECTGQTAVTRLIESAGKFNYAISIHHLAPEIIYFWASVPAAESIYEAIDSQAMGFEKVTAKLKADSITGYMDIAINASDESAILFFSSGEIFGGSYSWQKDDFDTAERNLPFLIGKIETNGAIFSFNKITLQPGRKRILRSTSKQPGGLNGIGAIESLLSNFEQALGSQKRIKTGFHTLLRKKFVQKVERYSFLDPFAAEFEYQDGKIAFYGDATIEEIVRGVTESISELSEELGLKKQLLLQLEQWFKAFEKEVVAIQIRI